MHDGGPHQAEPISIRKAYYTVGILSLAYAFSSLDRVLPNLLLPSIKADLALTDTQVSLLSGLSFALFYSLAALPLSSLADRWSRRGVIAWGVLVWGLSTTMCGAAGSFALFFIARMGVGLGESALSPATFSLIADIFPPARRARATAIYVIGAAAGTGLAMLGGAGAVNAAMQLKTAAPDLLDGIAAWKLVLGVMGLLTVALVPFLLLIADPRKTRTATDGRAPSTITFPLLFRVLWRERCAYAPLMLGIPLLNVSYYGFISWVPTFFVRTHGWTITQTGFGVGVASLIGGIGGALGGGWLADFLSRRSPVVPLLLCVASAASSVVLAMLMAITSSPGVHLVLTGALSAVGYPLVVLGTTSLQQIAPPNARAQVTSIFMLIGALTGIGFGATCVALLTDYLFRNEAAVGMSMALLFLVMFCISAPLILLNRHAFAKLAKAHAASAL